MIKYSLSVVLLFLSVMIQAQVIYVSADGADNNDGKSINEPATIYNAVLNAVPGTTIYVRGGRYMLHKRIELTNSGLPDQTIRIVPYQLEHPVFDAVNVPVSPSDKAQAVYISGNQYYVKGIEITNAYKQGMVVRGCHNTIENCVSHHNGNNGFSITLEVHGVANDDGEKAAYNNFINCDSYLNFDWYKTSNGVRTPGSDANGFGCSLNAGKGNRFYGCRSWSNADDGFDLFESGFAVVIDNCWTWRTGVIEDFAEIFKQKTGETLTPDIFKGNGNGFKLGGNHGIDGSGCTKQSTGTHELRNSVSFGNRVRGIDQNAHKDGSVVENCVSFNNGINIRFWQKPNDGKSFVFNNNIIFGTGTTESGFTIPVISTNNSWDKGQPVYTADDFITVKTEDAMATREVDGSLPATNFGKLKKTVGIYSPEANKNRESYLYNNLFYIMHPQKCKLTLYSSLGVLKQVLNIDESASTIDLSNQPSGAYIVSLNTETVRTFTKIIKR